MTDLTTEKLDEIRRLAKAATPGPWASEDECVLQPRPDLGILPGLTMETSVVVAECGGRAFDSPRPADAAFIAAVDPLTAKAMAEEILRLRAKNAKMKAAMQSIASERACFLDMCDSYKADLDAIAAAFPEDDDGTRVAVLKEVSRLRKSVAELRKSLQNMVDAYDDKWMDLKGSTTWRFNAKRDARIALDNNPEQETTDG